MLQNRKRKRRQGSGRPPVNTQLVLDARLKGDVGVIADELFSTLFPWLSRDESPDAIHHIAIAPQAPPVYRQPDQVVSWTILAVRRRYSSAADTQADQHGIRFPAASSAIFTFTQNLQKTSNNIARLALQVPIDIQILDIVPIGLDTVVVSIDEEALTKLEAANQKFRKGSSNGGLRQKAHQRSNSLGSATGSAERWESAIRASIAAHHVIHTKEFIPLPLPAHPITHVAPPPAIVEMCEPVSQGVVLAETRIVVVPAKDHARHARTQVTSPTFASTNGTVPEEDEDTSNEQFYSAAESPAGKSAKLRRTSESDMEPSETNDEDTDFSDGDSNTLGLSLPSLPSQPAGTFSALTAATPRVGNPFLDGMASPGSAVSGYSMSTVVGNGTRGKLCEAQGLLAPIPGDTLHPKPLDEEDEEARAYVDTALLTKVGCFSGDWVRIEAAPNEGLNTLGNWGLNSFNEEKDQPKEWRVVKLFAFPGLSSKRPRYTVTKAANRRSGSFLLHNKAAPKVYLSPVTLSNLGGVKNVRISKVDLGGNRRHSRQPLANLTSQYPPVARDVSLQKFSTPIAHEKSLDAGLRWALERHFKQKARIVKSGDLIAIPINVTLARALHTGSMEEDGAQQELLASSEPSNIESAEPQSQSVAWFRVGAMHADQEDIELPWGSLAVVRPEVTKLAQAGDYQGRVPDTMHSTWPYYFGTRRLPPMYEVSSAEDRQMQRPKVHISRIRHRLRELISIATSPQALHALPPTGILLVSAQRHVGKSTVVEDACADLGMHCFSVDAYDILSEGGGGGGDVQTAGFLESRLERGLLSGAEHTALLLKHVDILTADRMVAAVKTVLAQSRVLVATTTNVDKVPEAMRSLCLHEVEFSAPDEKEREGILRTLLQERGLPLAADVDLSSIAMKTAALVAGDLADVVDRAAVARHRRLEKLTSDNNTRIEQASQTDSSSQLVTQGTPCILRDVHIAMGPSAHNLTANDFTSAVEDARKNFADAIGAPKIPNVSWDDVGGLSNVKDSVLETIQLPLERPELFAKGMKKRSGILFYGPPGTGKTLLAKAIATEFSLNFFSVKGPELLNMYIGESEANVRRVFQRARDARPCVVFFDELDSVAPKRGNQGDSGGVMDRIVSQLLAELDGMSSSDDDGKGGSGVFVIGATNRPDLLDQALLRPGRFDKMLYLGVSDTHEKQLTILEALTRKFTLHHSLSLSNIAHSLPLTYTGADLYALSSDAMLKAITRRAAAVDAKVRAINAQRAARRPSTQSLSRSTSHSMSRSTSHSMSRSTSHSSHHLSTTSNANAETESPDLQTQSVDRVRRKGEISVAYFFDHLATAEDTEVVVEEEDFVSAQAELVPSVTAKELEHYERVRRAFERVEDGTSKHEAKMNGRIHSEEMGLLEKTQRMSLNGDVDARVHSATIAGVKGGGGGMGKGKGKGKEKIVDDAGNDFGFGSVTDDDAAMYS
ncbi:MAG: hypothetical protein Q9162_006045 [Coniocarpon cinnabarinum]